MALSETGVYSIELVRNVQQSKLYFRFHWNAPQLRAANSLEFTQRGKTDWYSSDWRKYGPQNRFLGSAKRKYQPKIETIDYPIIRQSISLFLCPPVDMCPRMTLVLFTSSLPGASDSRETVQGSLSGNEPYGDGSSCQSLHSWRILH
jgi:hypothetical protein